MLDRLIVRYAPGNNPSAGLLLAGHTVYPCLLGKHGISSLKREGDGKTPAGRFRLLFGFYRTDKAGLKYGLDRSGLAMMPIKNRYGWCDQPESANYNRPVKLPFAGSHEKLWRDDALYDVVIVMDHNYSNRVRNRGSAVFFHLIGNKPYTEGCVALARENMLRLLPLLSSQTIMDIRL